MMASREQMRDISLYDEYRNGCMGEENCKTCGRYLDDCDGKEEE